MTHLLHVEDLHTYFQTPRGIVKSVDGVSFDLDQGRTLGIVGESGSGKSVLARSIMELLPRQTAIRAGGKIVYGGRDLRMLSQEELRQIWGKEMAIVFQDPMTSLNPVMKIGHQITEPLRLHLEMSRREATAKALELLNSVGIPEPRRRLDQYPHELSGGMRQRVTIAIALSCGPRLLIADEPTTALDVTVQAQILDLLKQQQVERNMAMILISHDLAVVAAYADEIAVMYGGHIVERAPTQMLFKSFRMPYTEALMRSIPRVANPSHTRLEVIPGRPPDPVNLPTGCRFAPRCRYARSRCAEEEPPLEGIDEDHEYRCWFPITAEEHGLTVPDPQKARI